MYKNRLFYGINIKIIISAIKILREAILEKYLSLL